MEVFYQPDKSIYTEKIVKSEDLTVVKISEHSKNLYSMDYET